MATRYVWGKYQVTTSIEKVSEFLSPSKPFTPGNGDYTLTTANESGLTIYWNGNEAVSFSIDTPLESYELTRNQSITLNPGTFFELWDNGSGFTRNYTYDTLKLYFDQNGWPRQLTASSGSAWVVKFVKAQGTSVGTVSNSSNSAYPSAGISGSNWYTYQGSDSIDATAVGYSNQFPMGGQPITINVTPATPTYGGTIQYTYQVQLSGGSWTTIATKTTATSQQYTIPAGTTSFAARVVANDTWGFSSSTYTTGSTLTVTNNLPPTAPGSISIGSVVGGQQCTITWTAATDPDGTVASYQLERQTDNGDTWTQIYSGSNLTYTDTINADWATVNYRVKATDDDGDSGPYATGTMQTVNDGWLYFSGPPSDMGEQPAPFNFVFSIGSTGATSASSIAVTVIYDDETIYTGTVTSAQQITLPIDTRLTYAGDHDIIVTATANGFLAVTQQCDFTVPSVTLPNGGAAGIMEDDAGKPYYPATLARFVIGLKGLDANALFDRVYTGTYTGTGTSGSGNPCSVRTSFEPILVFIQAAAASTATSGYWVNSAPGQSSQGNMIVNNNGAVTLCPVTWDAEAMTLSWYGTSAAAQLNASGTVYGIIALGGMA